MWRTLADVARSPVAGGVPPTQVVDDRWPAHLHIDLLPKARGAGFGRGLVTRWLDTLRADGVAGCHLETWAENDGAVAFFEAMGFRGGPAAAHAGVRSPEGHRHHSQLMVQDLAPAGGRRPMGPRRRPRLDAWCSSPGPTARAERPAARPGAPADDPGRPRPPRPGLPAHDRPRARPHRPPRLRSGCATPTSSSPRSRPRSTAIALPACASRTGPTCRSGATCSTSAATGCRPGPRWSGSSSVLALARYNQLQLYIEHTFAYRDHEAVWRDASPLTADDLALARRPLRRRTASSWSPTRTASATWTAGCAHPAYRAPGRVPRRVRARARHAAAARRCSPRPPDNAAFALAPVRRAAAPASAAGGSTSAATRPSSWARAPAAPRSSAGARARSTSTTSRRIVEPLVAGGHEVQVWADVLRHDPAPGAAELLPAATVTAAGAGPTRRRRPAGGARRCPTPIAARARATLGHRPRPPTPASPATRRPARRGRACRSGWRPARRRGRSLVGRIDNARANLLDAADVGRPTRAPPATWSPTGATTATSSRRRSASGPLVYGGAVAWGVDANRDLALAAVLDRHVFADATGTLSGAVDRLGRQWPKERPRFHSALSTSRSKRTCSVWVGVNAVKSCVPGSASAQRSSRPG